MSADIFRIVNAQNYKIDSLDSGLDALERMFDDLDRAGYTRLARELSDVLKQSRACEHEEREEGGSNARELEEALDEVDKLEDKVAKLEEEVRALEREVEEARSTIDGLDGDIIRMGQEIAANGGES